MQDDLNDEKNLPKSSLPRPVKSGGDMLYRELHREYRTTWVKRQRFSWGEIVVERRHSKNNEWVHIEPTHNQPNSILVVSRRVHQGPNGLRYHCAMYVNRKAQITLAALRQAMPYRDWLEMCVNFAINTRRDYAPQLYQLRYMVENFPEFSIGGMTMPAFDENGDYIK